MLGYSGQPFTLWRSGAENAWFIHPILYQKDCTLLLLMSSTHGCGKWRGKKKWALERHMRVADVKFSALYDRGTIQRQKGKKSIRQLGGIPPHRSVRVRQKGEERNASWELLDFVQSRKIICSLHLPHHHMLPLKSPLLDLKGPEFDGIRAFEVLGYQKLPLVLYLSLDVAKKWNPRWLIR